MNQAYRWTVLPSLVIALSACGGGGGGSSSSTSSLTGSHNFAVGGSNVVTVTVGSGVDAQSQAFNIPVTSVTVCVPNSTTCATINNVLVDTGSSGLRLIASVLATAGVTLTPMADPNALNAGSTIHECLPFADGYAWGAVATATVSIGGERAAAIPVQVIDDSATPAPAAPRSCTTYGTSLGSVNALDANGVLGIGVLTQDCGPGCAATASYNVYYSCASSGSCSPSTQSVAEQVANPVASFPTDNNGVILQLPAIAATGAATATGYLVFGIGTEGNNGLGDATVLTADLTGQFITKYGTQTLSSSFIDSGSNGLYFPDSSIALCGSSGGAANFYCPSTTLTTSAVNQGENGATSTVSFQIANPKAISGSNFALDDVGGPAPAANGLSGYFDWGLPFFYGRTVFTAIEGKTAADVAGPYYAY